MSGETFTDATMLEIFRAEVETHVESLTSGLLALERDPKDTSHIDEMMRGAHSIKGAARIVGINPAVRIAHVMEDGFVAAQNGKLTLCPDHVDVLLRGVDLLNRIAHASKETAIDWNQFESEATPLVAEISTALAGKPSVTAAPPSLSRPGEPPVSKPDVADRSLTTASEITITIPQLLDAAAAETVRRAFVEALDAKVRLIRFDLSQTNDLDATGLALLAAIPTHVGGSGPHVELIGISNDLSYVLEVTGIDRTYSSGGR